MLKMMFLDQTYGKAKKNLFGILHLTKHVKCEEPTLSFLVGTMSNIFLISFLKIIYFFISVLLFPFYLFFALH